MLAPSSLGRAMSEKGNRVQTTFHCSYFVSKCILHSNCVLQSLLRSGFSQNLIVLYSLLSSRGLIKHGQYWGSAPGNCQCYSIPCSIQSYWALEVLWHEMGGSWFWILPIVLDLSCSQSRTKSANLAIAHYVKNWISNYLKCISQWMMRSLMHYGRNFFSRPFDLLLQSYWLW